MLHSSALKAAMLVALVSATGLCHAESADLAIGRQLSAQELKQYANVPTVTLGAHSLKVISSTPQPKAAGAAPVVVTKVINEKGVVGESRNNVVTSLVSADKVKQVAAGLSPSPVSSQYYAHLNVATLRFASFPDAVSASIQLKKVLPQAQVDVPIRYAEPSAR